LQTEKTVGKLISIANLFLEQNESAALNAEKLNTSLPNLKEKTENLANGNMVIIDAQSYASEVKKNQYGLMLLFTTY